MWHSFNSRINLLTHLIFFLEAEINCSSCEYSNTNMSAYSHMRSITFIFCSSVRSMPSLIFNKILVTLLGECGSIILHEVFILLSILKGSWGVSPMAWICTSVSSSCMAWRWVIFWCMSVIWCSHSSSQYTCLSCSGFIVSLVLQSFGCGLFIHCLLYMGSPCSFDCLPKEDFPHLHLVLVSSVLSFACVALFHLESSAPLLPIYTFYEIPWPWIQSVLKPSIGMTRPRWRIPQ